MDLRFLRSSSVVGTQEGISNKGKEHRNLVIFFAPFAYLCDLCVELLFSIFRKSDSDGLKEAGR